MARSKFDILYKDKYKVTLYLPKVFRKLLSKEINKSDTVIEALIDSKGWCLHSKKKNVR